MYSQTHKGFTARVTKSGKKIGAACSCGWRTTINDVDLKRAESIAAANCDTHLHSKHK